MRLSRSVPIVGSTLALLMTTACATGGHSTVSAPTTSSPSGTQPFTVQIDAAAEQLATGVRVDLDEIVRRELGSVAAALHSPRATVNLVINPKAAIPEVGVGGFTNPATGLVTVSLDPQSRIGVAKTMRVWVPLTLAHELSHSTRVLNGPGYGTTLVETIVTEGLADQFSRSLHSDVPPIPWDDALTRRQEHDLWTAAQGEATNLQIHGRWFFGTGDVPRWAGYTLGAHVVAAYRARNPRVAWADVTRLPAEQIVAASGYAP